MKRRMQDSLSLVATFAVAFAITVLVCLAVNIGPLDQLRAMLGD